jgi:hypothetical protein
MRRTARVHTQPKLDVNTMAHGGLGLGELVAVGSLGLLLVIVLLLIVPLVGAT